MVQFAASPIAEVPRRSREGKRLSIVAPCFNEQEVLDLFFGLALRQQPDFVEAQLASAELALEKHDSALAAQTLEKAAKDAAGDPRFHYLLARAFADDDPPRAAKALIDALELNPRHADSLLLRVDQLIDAEKYAEAEQVLKKVVETNPAEPRATATSKRRALESRRTSNTRRC